MSSYLINDLEMKKVFGDSKDEYGVSYNKVYKNEIDDIEKKLKLIQDDYSLLDLSVIFTFLIRDTFGDTVTKDSKVYYDILVSIKKGDYIEGIEYYGFTTKKVKGWVDRVYESNGYLVYDIQADDSWGGYRGTSISSELGEVTKLDYKERIVCV